MEDRKILVIIGSGPVGVQFAHELIKRGYRGLIKLFGDEPWRPYNRIQLSSLLAGEVRYGDILYPELRVDRDHFHFLNRRVISVDLSRRCVLDDKGVSHQYDKLVHATGSRPWVPDIEGTGLAGVYVFRDLSHAQQLMARSVRTRRTVIVGGGLLGVEVARAMQRNNTQVVLVHQGDRLMNRQLDQEAGAMLQRTLEGYGVEVILKDSVRRLCGQRNVTSVALRNGTVLECDTVVFTTGIHPNVELARDSGVRVGQGIQVNDQLETSQEDVYALGECVEHRGHIYGLLTPGLEQAAILADRLCGGSSRYQGSIAATGLNVLGLPTFTLGWVGDEYANRIDRTVRYRSEQGHYRKLYLQRNRLCGFVGVGNCEEYNRIQRAVHARQRILPWQIARFRLSGRIWREGSRPQPWPGSSANSLLRVAVCGLLLAVAVVVVSGLLGCVAESPILRAVV